MAQITKKRPENVEGNFFVDETCIDCDACRWVAPGSFHESGGQSAVYRQPADPAENFQALQALVCCPTASIGTVRKPDELSKAVQSFPLKIKDEVFYCGYHSERSYGAASYFIKTKSGNVLVDSPRFAAPLVKNIEAMGGIKYLYLTHRDDVAEHEAYQKHFHCQRILHADDVSQDTRNIEMQIKGEAPIKLEEDLTVIPVPGHTKGHTTLLFKNEFLFTGDHLAYSPELGHLYAFRGACWYSWPKLVQSMKTLAQYDFEWVLPGHGRRFRGSKQEMKDQMKKCVQWMQK